MECHLNRSSLAGIVFIIFSLSAGSIRGADQLHEPSNIAYLQSLNDKKSLTNEELKQARDAMLKINNEARLNSDYRKLKTLKNDLNLPSNLDPLVLSDKLNEAAQEQAEGAAGLKRLPRGTAIPGAMASGTAASLADFPIGWQVSESTYRPTWNLGGKAVDSVGFGMAKSAAGQWSVVAIWADLGGAQFKDLGLHDLENIKKLTSFSDKATLTAEDLTTIRACMLQINNEARTNPEYRKKMGSTADLDLPKDLEKLVLDEAANKAAQVQADYQASTDAMSHDNRNYRDYDDRMLKLNVPGALEACAFSSSLSDMPIGWMKGETHYRPTWNIDIPVHRVGYGVAKSARSGRWYFTAIWLPVAKGEIVAKTPEQPAQKDPFAPTSPPAVTSPVTVAPAAGKTPTEAAAPSGEKIRLAAEDAPYRGKNYIPQDLKTVDGKKPHGIDYFTRGQSGTVESELTKGGILHMGDILGSPDGGYRLIINFNGKLAITDAKGKEKWSAGGDGTHVEYQAGDGNFCLYDKKKVWKWGTQKFGPNMVDGSVRLTNDGVLEQLDKDGKRVWASE